MSSCTRCAALSAMTCSMRFTNSTLSPLARAARPQSRRAIGERAGVAHGAQLGSDALADLDVPSGMDGIAREMELAALPGGASGHGAPGCTQSRVIIRQDELDAAQTARDRALEEAPPVNLGLGQGHGNARNTPPLVRTDADSREHVRRENDPPDRFLVLLTVPHDPAAAHLLVPGVEDGRARKAECDLVDGFHGRSTG